MRRALGLALLVSLYSVGPARALTLTVGNHVLLPNTTGQVIHLYVMAEGGEQVQGLTLRAQFGDGGPGLGGADVTPLMVGNITSPGTVFGANNLGANDASLAPSYVELDTATAFGTIALAPGANLLATLTFDTTGFGGPIGNWPLLLAGTAFGDTMFDSMPMTIENGWIGYIPEPSSIATASLALMGLCAVALRPSRGKSVDYGPHCPVAWSCCLAVASKKVCIPVRVPSFSSLQPMKRTVIVVVACVTLLATISLYLAWTRFHSKYYARYVNRDLCFEGTYVTWSRLEYRSLYSPQGDGNLETCPLGLLINGQCLKFSELHEDAMRRLGAKPKHFPDERSDWVMLPTSACPYIVSVSFHSGRVNSFLIEGRTYAYAHDGKSLMIDGEVIALPITDKRIRKLLGPPDVAERHMFYP